MNIGMCLCIRNCLRVYISYFVSTLTTAQLCFNKVVCNSHTYTCAGDLIESGNLYTHEETGFLLVMLRLIGH